MYSYGHPHMAGQKQDWQLEHTFSSYVRIRNVALKTYQGRLTIGRSGERGSGISVLTARHDDDEDDNLNSLISWLLSFTLGFTIVIYWPSTEPSIKRWTWVNKRKNTRIRWSLENSITRCPGASSQLETGCRSENQLQTEGFGPLLTPGWAIRAKMRKKCCYGRGRTWVNIAVSTHFSHTTNINFSKIKCERFI